VYISCGTRWSRREQPDSWLAKSICTAHHTTQDHILQNMQMFTHGRGLLQGSANYGLKAACMTISLTLHSAFHIHILFCLTSQFLVLSLIRLSHPTILSKDFSGFSVGISNRQNAFPYHKTQKLFFKTNLPVWRGEYIQQVMRHSKITACVAS